MGKTTRGVDGGCGLLGEELFLASCVTMMCLAIEGGALDSRCSLEDDRLKSFAQPDLERYV